MKKESPVVCGALTVLLYVVHWQWCCMWCTDSAVCCALTVLYVMH